MKFPITPRVAHGGLAPFPMTRRLLFRSQVKTVQTSGATSPDKGIKLRCYFLFRALTAFGANARNTLYCLNGANSTRIGNAR